MNRTAQLAATFCLGLLLVASAPAHADIFQWEYLNPADPSQGKRQSATLCASGVDAVPGANFSYGNLIMAYLDGADLTNASGRSANLTKASFVGANLSGAYFTFDNGRYVTNLTDADLSQANLSDANFNGAVLTNADLTRAEIRGARFNVTIVFEEPDYYVPYGGLTLAQLYSTASYQEGDIRGVSGLHLSNAITKNIILPNGHIDSLDLDAGAVLVVRDYDGKSDTIPPNVTIPITVDQHFEVRSGGTLRLVFDEDAWDSAISFAPGIPVTLGGTLELTFAPGVNPATQVGRTFDLFNWTGVTPTGAFAVSSPYAWDLSNLYATGEVTLTAIPEPAAFDLAALGLLGLVVGGRRS